MAEAQDGADLAKKVRDRRDFEAAYQLVSEFGLGTVTEVMWFLYPEGDIRPWHFSVFDMVADAVTAFEINEEMRR